MKVTVMLKDGGYDTVDIPYKQVGVLAKGIDRHKSVPAYSSKNGKIIQVVGFSVGKESEQVEA